MFVVGKKRIVGSKEFADARGVMDGGVKVGVVGGLDGLEEGCIRARCQGCADRIARRFVCRCIEKMHETAAQCAVAGRFAGHEGIERGGFAGCENGGRQCFKKARAMARSKTENEGANADADVAAPM
jgi:hypothetical protein